VNLNDGKMRGRGCYKTEATLVQILWQYWGRESPYKTRRFEDKFHLHHLDPLCQYDTSLTDGQIKKTVSIAKLRRYRPDFTFTPLREGQRTPPMTRTCWSLNCVVLTLHSCRFTFHLQLSGFILQTSGVSVISHCKPFQTPWLVTSQVGVSTHRCYMLDRSAYQLLQSTG